MSQKRERGRRRQARHEFETKAQAATDRARTQTLRKVFEQREDELRTLRRRYGEKLDKLNDEYRVDRREVMLRYDERIDAARKAEAA